MTRQKGRPRKRVPFVFDPNTPPPYKPGYLDSRYREYAAFDSLPSWARKVLRRTRREWQAIQILNRLKDGDKPLDILADLERCEQVYSNEHFEDLTLEQETTEWRLRKQER